MGQNDYYLDQHENKPHRDGDCETLYALIPAYSLGATDPDETRLVESLLDSCPEVAAELAAYSVLADKLLFSAPPTTAPARLREKLMASIRSDPVSTSRSQSSVRTGQPVRHVLANHSWHPALLAAVFAVVLLVLLNLYWAAQLSVLQNMQQAITRRLEDHTDVLTLIGAGETQRTEFWNSDQTIHAAILCDPEEPLGFVYASDFPPLLPDMVYQLWLIRAQQRVNAGSFLVDENGEGSLVFHTDEPLGRYQAAEITIEKTGAVQPSSPVLVGGTLNC